MGVRMSLLRIEFPVLIALEGGHEYRIKPLFLDSPIESDRRYRVAMDRFHQSVMRIFRSRGENPISIEKLKWFLFNPNIRFEVIPLAFKMGQRLVDDRFLAVWYHLHDHIILILPAFDNFSCALPAPLSLTQLHSHVESIVQNLFRRFKEDGEEVDPSRYASAKGHSVTVVTIDVEYDENDIKLSTLDPEELPALLTGNVAFTGARELAKTGRVVNDLFPNNLQPAFRRERVVAQVDEVVFGDTIIPAVLVGPEGVGRTSVLHQAVGEYLRRCSAEEKARRRTVWHVDPQRVISGMSVVGEWQRRFEAMLDHLAEKDHIMFIDDVVPLFRIGKSSQNTLTLSDVLKPYLENRSVRVVMEATPGEWERVQEADRRFADLFRVIRITEPRKEDLVSMFVRTRQALELRYEVTFDLESLDFLWKWNAALLSGSAQPGSLVAAITQLAVRYRGGQVSVSKALQMFAERGVALDAKKIPAHDRSEVSTVRDVARLLVGQADAVTALGDVIETVRARLGSGEKPEASLLFTGPTGVGKTYAAKLLAEVLYGSQDSLLRFDMNEYVDAEAAGRLIGDAYHPEGLLTSAIRLHPHAVVLFDEIEKAHPFIHDLLLQVLGEGRLTDVMGRTSDFTHAVIVLTSNLGAQQAGREVGFERTEEVIEQTYRTAVRQFFRPEFTNRIDRLVVFRRLLPEDIRAIAALEIGDFFRRDGLIRRNVIVSPSRKALERLAHEGYDHELGARALKRHIEAALAQTIAERLVAIDPREPVLIQLHDPGAGIAVHVEKFTPVSTVPSYRVSPVPGANRQREFLEGLLSEMKAVDDVVAQEVEEAVRGTDPRDVNPHRDALYVFRESVRTHITNLLGYIDELESRSRGSSTLLPYRFRLKHPRGFRHGNRTDWLNVFSQLEIKDYIDDLYQKSASVVPVNDQFFAAQFLQTAFLRFLSRGLHTYPWPRIAIELVPLSPATTTGVLVAMIERTYESVIDENLVDITGVFGENVRVFSGPRIDDLFQSESGVVLGYRRNEPPEAVHVRIHRVAPYHSIDEICRHFAPREEFLRQPEILRLYTSAKGESSCRITDFRTGIIGEFDVYGPWVDPDDHRTEDRESAARMQSRLLLFAGLPPVDWLAVPGEL
jgi:ATP-dependent Clp protease ATP-binding subunit ClpC